MEEFSFDAEKTTKKYSPIPTEKQQATLSLVKVYLWFALGLLITGVVSLALPFILTASLNGQNEELVAKIYIGMIIASVILMIPSMVIIHVQGFRKNMGLMLTSYVIYAIAMGVLLSTIFFGLVDGGEGSQTICIAFFVTGGIFLFCGLFGALTKKSNLSAVYPIIFSIIATIFVVSIVNVFIGSSLVYWLTDFILFGVMIVVVMLDCHNIHKIADAGHFDNSNNLAIYCAFTLYVDFIWVFLRVAYYISLLKSNK